jgi:hypothetical protein
MDQQRVWIKGYCRDKCIQFGRRIIGQTKGKSRKNEEKGNSFAEPPSSKIGFQGVFNHGNLLYYKIYQIDDADQYTVSQNPFFSFKKSKYVDNTTTFYNT